MNKDINIDNREKIIPVLASVFSVIIGLLFGFYIMLLLDKQAAITGMAIMLIGPLKEGLSGFNDVLFYSVPLIMTGLAVGFAFKCGLFNIGASGQYIIGAFAAIFVGVKCTFLPPVIHCIVALVFAGASGAFWGMIPGMLKANRNVNEVISTLLMNYVALYLVNYLIRMTVYDSERNQTLPVAATAYLLSAKVGNTSINAGIVIALSFAIALYFILEKTTFGYEFRICGLNRFASQYSGMKEKKLIITSMSISGMLAGLGGALMYLSGQGNFLSISETVASQGFDGLSVALVAISSPIGIVIVALFLGYIYVGGQMIQLVGFSPEMVSMIVASIVYCGALTIPLRIIVGKIIPIKTEK